MTSPTILRSLLRLCGVAALAGACGLARAQDDADDPGLTALSATRDRPLFSPTRRAPPPPRTLAPMNDLSLTPALALPPPKPNLQLSGVIVGDGQQVAILKRTGDTRIMTVRIGASVDGWTVSAIAPREITLSRGDGQSAVVRLP